MNERQSFRNKIIFFPGTFITLIGSTLFSFATGLYLLDITGKGTSYAINMVLFTLPLVILSPVFGYIVDRVHKKKVIILCDFINGLVMLAIFLFWNRGDKVLLIYTGTLLGSIFSMLLTIAFEAGKPQMFEKNWLTNANSYSAILSSICRIGGPILGGIIYAITDIKYFILINAISFFLSMAFELFLSLDDVREKNKKIKFIDGLTYINENLELKKYILSFVLFNFIFAMMVIIPVPYIVNNIFKMESRFLGIIQSLLPVGMILGALLVKRYKINISMNLIKNIFWIFLLTGIFFLIPLSLRVNTWGVVVLYSFNMLTIGVILGLTEVPIFTYFQKSIPENLRGQVIGTFISLVKVVVPLTLLLSGEIIDRSSPRVSVYLGIFISFGVILSINITRIKNLNMMKKVEDDINCD